MTIIWILFYSVAIFSIIGSLIALYYSAKYDFTMHDTPATLADIPDVPSLTIIIPAYNEEKVIERSLKAAFAIDYPKLSLVIVNDASRDTTAQRIKSFLKTHSTSHIVHFIDLAVNGGKGQALNTALQAHDQSDLTMILDADCAITTQTVLNTLRYFNDPEVSGVAMHVCLKSRRKPLELIQRIEFIIGHRHKKYYSAANAEFTVSGQGSTYRTSVLKAIGGFRSGLMTEDIDVSLRVANLGNRQHRLVYAADALLFSEAVPRVKSLFRQRYRWKFGALQAIFQHRHLLFSRDRRYTRTLTHLRIPQVLISELLALLEPVFLGLFLYIAISQQSLLIFAGLYFSQMLYNMTVICLDEQESIKTRIILALCVPIMLPYFYLLTCINVAAAFACIKNSAGLTGKKVVSGAWQPPERVGNSL